MTAGGVPFLKGNATENDFILLPNRDGALVVSAGQVVALCDRHAGIGADGVVVVSPTAETGFFMDYRNADGSFAEMCGNGARLFARYLVDAGWEAPGTFSFATRGGRRTAELAATGDFGVGMGPATIGAESKAEVSGVSITGTAVDVGNPHLVCWVESPAELEALDLTKPPQFDSTAFPAGVNIEFVVPLAIDRIRMRVYERGVGETRSCGTGTVAAAAAHLSGGERAGLTGGAVTVEIPGGVVQVSFAAGGGTLTGPAQMVASGVIDRDFWNRHR